MQKNCIQLILLKIKKKFVWVCIIIKQTVIYLLMAKDSEIVLYPLCPCLGNISKDFSVDNMKKKQD